MKACAAAAGNLPSLHACKPLALETQHHPQALHSQPPKETSPEFNVSGAQQGHGEQSGNIFQDDIQSRLQYESKSSIFCIKIIKKTLHLIC